ncbi:nuclease [Mariprofundus sp. NF]|uniref:thermonuclease family protein n=1 Tax=Mariprofundus sp. NF TaxID=2608716 RepID=UPI0015A0C815|nr:thermonuclease family protein [Mariprofundus sp. NF]NWF38201.1 nuclease [Mariprofundus sp. NF]
MSQIRPTPFHYHARVSSVYDGDTCTVDIDLGLGVWKYGEKVRLYRINTPELRGDERAEGLISRDRLRELIDGKVILLETVKDKKGKYGRYLAEIWLATEDGSWKNINDQLVLEGLAEYKSY